MADLARRLDREARLINARGQNALRSAQLSRLALLQLNGRKDVLARSCSGMFDLMCAAPNAIPASSQKALHAR
jgi:hypothetical protein